MRYDRTARPHDLGMADVGERVCFLNRNGYDTELTVARERLTEGEVLTVEDVSIGGWTSSYRFKETGGQWFNTVMFQPLAQVDRSPEGQHAKQLDRNDESAVANGDAPKETP